MSYFKTNCASLAMRKILCDQIKSVVSVSPASIHFIDKKLVNKRLTAAMFDAVAEADGNISDQSIFSEDQPNQSQ